MYQGYRGLPVKNMTFSLWGFRFISLLERADFSPSWSRFVLVPTYRNFVPGLQGFDVIS